MRLLLDTHAIIWLSRDSDRLPASTRAEIIGAEASYISFAAAWEYGIKRKRRPEELPLPFDALVEKIPAERIGVPFELHRFAETLPPIHRDPFDRIMIAQAIALDLTFVTRDEEITRYPVKTLW